MAMGRLAEPRGPRREDPAWLDDEDLTVAKVHILLAREGVIVPAGLSSGSARGCAGPVGAGTTVRVADGEPGEELQVDFGRMGLIFDPPTAAAGSATLSSSPPVSAVTALCG